MDQPRAVERTRLEKLLQHYDIKDFIRFLAKKKFLSAFEHTLLSRLTILFIQARVSKNTYLDMSSVVSGEQFLVVRLHPK